MRIFLTGGTGNVGEAAVRRLVRSGHRVTVVGRSEASVPEGADYRICNVTDAESVRREMAGHDAVVHLAAIPSPYGRPGHVVFHSNADGTFNVYEAAAENGISRVVNASSINALGMFFGDRSPDIRYLPVDEHHPTLPTDAYSFAKGVTEQIGDYFYDRDGISGVSLRLPEVVHHELFVRRQQEHGANPWPVAAKLLDLPDERRVAELQRLHTAYDEFRRANRLDKRKKSRDRWNENLVKYDLLTRDEHWHMFRHVNLYAYLHEDDSAQVIERAVTENYSGHHAFFVQAQHNNLGLPLEEVAKLFWPTVPERRPPYPGDTCVPSLRTARELLGFEPEHVLQP